MDKPDAWLAKLKIQYKKPIHLLEQKTKLSTSVRSLILNQKFTELVLSLPQGLSIAIKCWGPEHADIKILALHGYMDNASTWDRLAPYLTSGSQSIRIVCMDFGGHGKSSHLPKCMAYSHPQYVSEVLGVADCLGWDKFVLMGHSMGGAVSTILAAAVPKRVIGLICIDMFGGVSSGSTPLHRLSDYLSSVTEIRSRQRRVYPDMEMPIAKYREAWTISRESTEILLERGMEEVFLDVFGLDGKSNEKGVCFRHDPRLRGTAPMGFSMKDSLEFCRSLKCPILVILAHNERRQISSPFAQMILRNVAAVDPKIMKLCILPQGNHHFHLDSPQSVFGEILSFVKDRVPVYNRSKL
eukprot:175604_1